MSRNITRASVPRPRPRGTLQFLILNNKSPGTHVARVKHVASQQETCHNLLRNIENFNLPLIMDIKCVVFFNNI